MSEGFSVVSPIGEESTKGTRGEKTAIARRQLDLNGKTVCEVWNGVFRGDALFPIIREQLKKRYPNIRIIPYTEAPIIRVGANVDEDCEALKEHLKETACDALIAATGG